MIINIGTDIIEIPRIKSVINRKKNFLNKVFTEKEVEYLNTKKNIYESAAGIFCAKEAVSKALGTGIRNFSFKDIEINRDENGKPYVNLYKNANSIKNGLGIDSITLSISHSRENAVAFVITQSYE